LVITIFCLLH